MAWKIQLKGDPALDEDSEDFGFELSVVKEGAHGEVSLGWQGEDKIILATQDDQYPDRLLSALFKTSHYLVALLNRRD